MSLRHVAEQDHISTCYFALLLFAVLCFRYCCDRRDDLIQYAQLFLLFGSNSCVKTLSSSGFDNCIKVVAFSIFEDTR